MTEIVVAVAADPRRGYARGDLVFSIDHRDSENVQVVVAGLHLPDVSADNTVTDSFDDGFIVVRRSSVTQQICSLQILRYEPGPVSVPELMDEIIGRRDRFLWDAVTTVMVQWALIAKLCETTSVVSKLHREWLLAAEIGKIAESVTHEPLWSPAGAAT